MRSRGFASRNGKYFKILRTKKFRKYENCIRYIFSLEKAGMNYDLRNTEILMEFLNHPYRNYKTIHIAGTNGKGSVASIINSVLIESGFTTGLYTSPHIMDFRERILINGKFIEKKFILDFINRIYKLIPEHKLSFFEIITAMAFEYFRDNKIDYAVIETGLGGRLDSTNIINPVLSVITGISYDHTDLLGNTLESITKEKSEIIKMNTPCIAGKLPEMSKKIIQKKCREKNSELIYTPHNFKINILKRTNSGFYFSLKGRNFNFNRLQFPVIGDYQIHNISTSLGCIEKIFENRNLKIKKKIISGGLKNIRSNSGFGCRFQVIAEKPYIIVDVSHNAQAIGNLKTNLKYLKYKSLFVIISMLRNKDYAKCLGIIEKLNCRIILTKSSYRKSAEPTELFSAVKNKSRVLITENISQAFRTAYKMCGEGDAILITGSFFLAGDFLKIYKCSVY